MVITLKNVPKDLAHRIKSQAKVHHRSMQGELMSILEQAVPARPKMTVKELADWVRARGISSPSESAQMVREMRDGR